MGNLNFKTNYSNGERRPVLLHKATCAKCKQETEVPFKPDGPRPVYCRECFQQQKPRRY